MVLELYYDILSEPSRAVYLFLKATGVPFEPKVVDLAKGEHFSPEYVKKNPWKKVPVIDDDGFVLSESVAIMRYIAAKYNLDEHWYPRNDVQKTARTDEFLNWHHHNFRRPMIDIWIPILLSRVGINEQFPKTPLDEKRVAKAKEEFTKGVNHLADYYLKDKPYIVGNDISAADFIALCHLPQLHIVGEEGLYESNPIVLAWVKRVKERLQPYFDETSVRYDLFQKMFHDAKE